MIPADMYRSGVRDPILRFIAIYRARHVVPYDIRMAGIALLRFNRDLKKRKKRN